MSVNLLRFYVLSLCVLSTTALANTMQDFPVPQRMQVWWVTKGDVHNGREVFIKKFKSSHTPGDIANFYRLRWQAPDELPGYLENETDGWQLISRLEPEHQWVVQIRANESGRGSEGFLSAMNINSLGTPSSSRVLRKNRFTEPLHGGNLLSSTELSDPTLARTQLLLYPGSPSRVANQFKTHMVSVGWSLQDEFSHQGTVTQRFEKKRHQIDVALVKHGGKKTLLFLNEVVSDEK